MPKNAKCLFPDGVSTEGMVSVSQLQTFMSCKKKWKYNYIENLTPRVERPYLTIGKLCHVGMQRAMGHKALNSCSQGYYREDSLNYGLIAIEAEFAKYMSENSFLNEEIPTLEKTLEDAESVFVQTWWEFDPDRWEVMRIGDVLALELHFLVPCAGSKGLHGYIDAILCDKTTGDVWCTDYKFRKSLSSDEEESFNIQNAIYCHACEKIGIDITGTMTWQHCNTPAAKPQLNKNGTMSRAKIKTTWKLYQDALINAGLDPTLYYEEMFPKLAEIEWFRETHEYRNKPTVDNIWKSIVIPNSRAVKSAHSPKAKNYPSMYPWNCKMCQYRDLCQAELRGYDVEFIKTSQYSKRLSRSVEEDKNIIDDNGQDVI